MRKILMAPFVIAGLVLAFFFSGVSSAAAADGVVEDGTLTSYGTGYWGYNIKWTMIFDNTAGGNGSTIRSIYIESPVRLEEGRMCVYSDYVGDGNDRPGIFKMMNPSHSVSGTVRPYKYSISATNLENNFGGRNSVRRLGVVMYRYGGPTSAFPDSNTITSFETPYAGVSQGYLPGDYPFTLNDGSTGLCPNN